MKVNSNIIKAILSIADQGVVSLTNFGVAFLLARAVSVEDFGLYIILFSIWLFVNNLQIGFINQGLLVLIESEDESYQKNMPVVQTLFSTAIFFLLSCISLITTTFNSTFSLPTLLLISLVLSLLTLKEYCRNHSLAQLKLIRTISYDTLFFLLVMIPVVVLYKSNSITVLLSWGLFGVASAVVVVVDLVLHGFHRDIDVGKIPAVLKTNFNLTKWTTLTNILIWGNGNIYKYVVTGYLGIEILAAVGAAQYITFLLNPILAGMHNFGTAFLSKKRAKDEVGYSKLFKSFSIIFFFLVAGLLLPILLFPEFFLKLFYGEKYLGYGLILQIFALSLIISQISRLINMDLLVRKISKSVFQIYATSVSVTFILVLTLLTFQHYNGFLIYLVLKDIIVLSITYVWVKK